MISVKLDRSIGMTLARMPDGILALVKGNLSEGGGEMCFDIEDTSYSGLLDLIGYYTQRTPTVSNVDGRNIEVSVGSGAAMYTPRRPAAAPVGQIIGGDRDIQADAAMMNAGITLHTAIGEDVNVRAYQVPGVAPAPIQTPRLVEEGARCRQCGRQLEDCDCERCIDCDELTDDCVCVEPEVEAGPEFRNVEELGSLSRDLNAMSTAAKVDKEQIPIIIASKLGGDNASRAKMLFDKISAYNRAMGNLMTMQNDISRLSTLVCSEPLIAKINAEIEALVSADNMVEEIYFTQQFLVIRTKELITNPLRDNKRRRIGKMEFYISLEAMFGLVETGRYPIMIRNRTRESNEYECGHVASSGLPCLGTWTEPVLRALKSNDLGQLVDVLVRFVRSPNEDDAWGRPIKDWPVVEEEINQ